MAKKETNTGLDSLAGQRKREVARDKKAKGGTLRGGWVAVNAKTGKLMPVASRGIKSPPTKPHLATVVRVNYSAGKFIPETGRVILSSPAKPRLGQTRIRTAVRSYVHRDPSAKKIK